MATAEREREREREREEKRDKFSEFAKLLENREESRHCSADALVAVQNPPADAK